MFTQPFIQAQIKKTSKLRVIGLCVGNSPVTGEFPTQRANNAENVSVRSRHHEVFVAYPPCDIVHDLTVYTLWHNECQIFGDFTHWGRVTHICASNFTIIGSDNGLPFGRRQAAIWTNARILLIRTLRTNFSENLSEIYTFSFNKMHL